MAQKINKNDLILFLGFLCILLFLALLISLLTLVLQGRPGRRAQAPEPGESFQIDAETLMENAARFNVSTEYLQLLLPDYLIYQDGAEYVFSPLSPALPRHEYDWDKLRYDFGRIHYRDEKLPIRYGVDVSTYQGEIDWQAVAGDEIDFAMIRLGYRGYSEGGLFVDEFAQANLDGAAAAGLELGAYFFSQAISPEEAEQGARLALEQLNGRELAFPVVFDMEEIDGDEARTAKLSIQQRTEIAAAFCRVIEDAGYQPMIYGNIRWLAGRIDLTQLSEYPLWLAQYYERPLLPYAFQMWQYTDSGEVEGIQGGVDLNISFSDFGE